MKKTDKNRGEHTAHTAGKIQPYSHGEYDSDIDIVRARFAKLGIGLFGFHLPAPHIDLHRWATIACDQHTSNRAYWKAVERKVGTHHSTLRLALPEIYLSEPDMEQRIEEIHRTMEKYLADGTLVEQPAGFVFVQRKIGSTAMRNGLLVMLDLACYDWRTKSQSLIRPTEETIESRLPIRGAIRRNALLEVPHILVLYDDPSHRIVDTIYEHIDMLPHLYDVKLMQKGGQLSGSLISHPHILNIIAMEFEQIAARANDAHSHPMLFAVGDGNHSLAAAAMIWNDLQQEAASPGKAAAPIDHPSRYAMVELINIHDPSLNFEPIHRVLFECDEHDLWQFLVSHNLSGERVDTIDILRARYDAQRETSSPLIGFVGRTIYGLLSHPSDDHMLAGSPIAKEIDNYSVRGTHRIDYIHGTDDLIAIARKSKGVGI